MSSAPAPVAPLKLHEQSWLRKRRFVVLGCTLLGVLLFAASYAFPYWEFKLVAPQYPKGLLLHIALTGITGDVKEIDILNHYIGMRSMSDAASLEKAMGGYLVALASLSIVVGLVVAGKRLGWLGLIPALGLPLGFIADVVYWMYTFGHSLAEDAPLHFEPFMPIIIGAGTIGQFQTTAYPSYGFWMSIAGAVLVSVAVMMRKTICDACPSHAACGKHCNHLLVVVPKDPA